ncbi:hypothetical protein ATCC90586_008566 [Pythium insidiosum]|nr:hypothetical protein ATCC90586_008566 [Pythium insidiosum]
MCAPTETSLSSGAVAKRRRSPSHRDSATAPLHRRLPGALVAQIISFVGGSCGWHMDDAAADGDLALLEDLQHCSLYTTVQLCSSRAMDYAAANDDLVVLQWLQQHRDEGCSPVAFHDAAKRGSVAVLEWLFVNQCPPDKRTALDNGVMLNAVESGQTSVVEWLCLTRPAFVPFFNAFDLACRNGHLSIAQCLDAFSSTRPGLAPHTLRALDAAADQGHLDIVRWLHRHRSAECTTDAMDFACAQGHLDVARWLHSHRSEGCTPRALIDAAANGHVAVVDWLVFQRAVPLEGPIVAQAKRLASRRGHASIASLLDELSQAFGTCATGHRRKLRVEQQQ